MSAEPKTIDDVVDVPKEIQEQNAAVEQTKDSQINKDGIVDSIKTANQTASVDDDDIEVLFQKAPSPPPQPLITLAMTNAINAAVKVEVNRQLRPMRQLMMEMRQRLEKVEGVLEDWGRQDEDSEAEENEDEEVEDEEKEDEEVEGVEKEDEEVDDEEGMYEEIIDDELIDEEKKKLDGETAELLENPEKKQEDDGKENDKKEKVYQDDAKDATAEGEEEPSAKRFKSQD